MYGPRPQKHVDPSDKTIPVYYQCSHTHVSGRRCNRRTIHFKSPCAGCVPVNGSASFCAECFGMLKAFGMGGR